MNTVLASLLTAVAALRMADRAARIAVARHPTKGPMWLTAPAYQIDGERGALGPAPLLGQHTDEVLCEHGFSPEEISELRTDGAVA